MSQTRQDVPRILENRSRMIANLKGIVSAINIMSQASPVP